MLNSKKGISMNTKKYSQVLRKVIDFQDYANLTYALGTQLNERKDRFDKSDLIEHCIEIYSNGYLYMSQM